MADHDQPPTIKSLEGWWAYAFQGLMWAENKSGISINASGLLPPTDPFRVNLAGANLQIVPATPTQPAHPPDTTLDPLPAMPELLAGFRPGGSPTPYYPAGGPAYFYPFCEIGYLHFVPANNQSVEGWLRENTSGYCPSSQVHVVTGRYNFDANGVTGVFTLQLPGSVANHVWDYHFVTVNNDELTIAVAGRLPRPAVGAGSLRRMS